MQKYRISTTLILAGIVALTMLVMRLEAQQKGEPLECRGRHCDASTLGAALFPESRGVEPKIPSRDVELNVFFEFNSATILPQHYSDIDELGKMLTHPDYVRKSIRLTGHTDAVGSELYNQRLSERRAQSVRSYLVKKFAITPQRIVAKGYGEAQPLSSNETEDGRSKNRRVQVEPGR